MRRALLLALRRRVRVFSFFRCELTDDGKERQSCKTCGHVSIHELPSMSRERLERFVAYRNQPPGISGRCQGCERIERDRRYPLEGTS